jgi:hypothetical protein
VLVIVAGGELSTAETEVDDARRVVRSGGDAPSGTTVDGKLEGWVAT